MKKENNKKYYIYEMNTTILSILSLVLLFLVVLITSFIDKELLFDISFLFEKNVIIVFGILLLYMATHELFHSLAYVIYGGKFNKIVYGIKLEVGVFYCLCKQNISKNNILHSLLYPLFFLGVVTYIISIIFELPGLLWLSIYNISGCAGDIIMFIFISKLNNIEFSEMDNPIAFGIYTDEDISNKKCFGLKYIKCSNELERKDFKKVTISKLSKVALIVFILLSVILELLR